MANLWTPYGPLNTNWFTGEGGWFPEFTWGSEQAPVQMPEFTTPAQNAGVMTPPDGRMPDWERQGRGGGMATYPPESQVPVQGSATDTPWGGYPADTMIPEVPNDFTPPPQKYSFLDAPGASDALVAFGASMLKAPDFNTGLGDAALAVNQVAQRYRPISEPEIARAKQLATLERLRRGETAETQQGLQVDTSTTYKSAEGDTLFPATSDGQQGMYNATKGVFIPFGTDGAGGLGQFDRDVYDPNTTRSKTLANNDAKFEGEFAKNIPNIAASVMNLDSALRLAQDPAAAVNSDLYTRIGGELERLMPGLGWQGFEADKITEYDNRIRNAAIQYARQSFQGQGQVTEWERRMIDEAIGQRGTMTNATAQKVLRVMRDAEQRKIDMFNEWNSNVAVKERFNYNFGAFVGWYVNEANKRQMGMNEAPASSGGQGGTTSSGVPWKIIQ